MFDSLVRSAPICDKRLNRVLVSAQFGDRLLPRLFGGLNEW